MVPSWAAKAAPVRPAGHDGAHLARHRQTHEVGDIDLRAEAGELDGPDEGQDETDQEADQRHDGQRARARFLNDQREFGAAVARPAAQQCTEGDDGLAEKGQEPQDLVVDMQSPFADPGEKAPLWCAQRRTPRRHGSSQGEQLSHTDRRALGVERKVVTVRDVLYATQEDRQRAAPGADCRGIDCQPRHGRLPGNLFLDRSRCGQR
jgi:hypothetical protein